MADSITGLGSVTTQFWTPPSTSQDITSSYISTAKFFQFTGTKSEATRIIDGIGQVINATFTFQDKDEQYDFLTFFQNQLATVHKFWTPVWNNQFTLNQTAYTNDTTLKIEKCFFAQSYVGYERIWIMLQDGSKIVRQITNAVEYGDYEELTLDTAIDRDIAIADIKYFGRFILCRFGSNDVEFDYSTTYFARTSVKFYELVQEYDENSDAEQNQFAELYEFVFPEQTYYYTSFYKDISFNNTTYTAVPMRRGTIESNINIFLDNKLEVVSRPTDALREYVANSTLLKVSVTITKLDIVTGTSKVIFRGTGGGIALKDEYISLSLTPLSSVFEFKIPKNLYQSLCNNILFGKGCGLVKDAWLVRTTVTLNSDGTLESSDFGAKSDGWFTGGYVSFKYNYRLITNHVGDKLWLQAPFNESVDGQKVSAYPGCDGSPQTCKNKFNNLDNFVGFPYIASRNPVIWGIK